MTFEMLMEEKFEAGMEKGIKKGREEGITKGLEQGAYNTKLETAKKLLLKGMTPAEISEVTSLSLETILKLKENA